MQESHTKVSSAVTALFDAQISMQKEFFSAATAGFKGVLALERDGLKAAAQAAETGVQYAKTQTAGFPESVRAWVTAFPGVDAELATRLAKDAEDAIATLNVTAEKGAAAAREAAAVAARQYENFLTEMETRGVETLKAAEQGAEKATLVARDVATGAFESAYAAADKAAETAKTLTPNA